MQRTTRLACYGGPGFMMHIILLLTLSFSPAAAGARPLRAQLTTTTQTPISSLLRLPTFCPLLLHGLLTLFLGQLSTPKRFSFVPNHRPFPKLEVLSMYEQLRCRRRRRRRLFNYSGVEQQQRQRHCAQEELLYQH